MYKKVSIHKEVKRKLKEKEIHYRISNFFITCCYFIMFVVSISLYFSKNQYFVSTLSNQIIQYSSATSGNIITNSTSPFNSVLLYWIGSLILFLIHFFHETLWNSSKHKHIRKDMLQKFGIHYRWISFYISTTFGYLTILSLTPIQSLSNLLLIIFLSLSNSIIMYSFDKQNRIYLMKINSDEDPVCRGVMKINDINYFEYTIEFGFEVLPFVIGIINNLFLYSYICSLVFGSNNYTTSPNFVTVSYILYLTFLLLTFILSILPYIVKNNIKFYILSVIIFNLSLLFSWLCLGVSLLIGQFKN